MFLPGKHKAKNPTIIYYLYIMDHETISYKTLIQKLSVQYTIVSHCLAETGKCVSQISVSQQPASTTQSKMIKNTNLMQSFPP